MKKEGRTNFFDSIPVGEDLEMERQKDLERKFGNLSEESKRIFKEILEAGDIRNFQDVFSEKDYQDFLRLYKGEVLKDNYLYQLAVMLCLKKYETIHFC